MKKTIYLVIICAWVIILSGCVKGAMMFFIDKDCYDADKRMEQLFHAFQKNDYNSIIDLFSKKAKSENKTINADAVNLLEYIDGEVLSWSRDESPITFSETEEGKHSMFLRTWFTLKTTKQSYLIFLADYPIDEIEPDNSGLYTLKIIKKSDENKLTGSFEDWTLPGIYMNIELQF